MKSCNFDSTNRDSGNCEISPAFKVQKICKIYKAPLTGAIISESYRFTTVLCQGTCWV